MTIGTRIATLVLHTARLDRILDIFQVASLVSSLLTNLLATSIIGHKAWSASTDMFCREAVLMLVPLAGRIGKQSKMA